MMVSRNKELILQHIREVCIQERMEELERTLVESLDVISFYADPETYSATTLLCDPPCGDIAEDFSSDYEHPDMTGMRLGKRARAFLNRHDLNLAAELSRIDQDWKGVERLIAAMGITDFLRVVANINKLLNGNKDG